MIISDKILNIKKGAVNPLSIYLFRHFPCKIYFVVVVVVVSPPAFFSPLLASS